jgi:hypothetical protein
MLGVRARRGLGDLALVSGGSTERSDTVSALEPGGRPPYDLGGQLLTAAKSTVHWDATGVAKVDLT